MPTNYSTYDMQTPALLLYFSAYFTGSVITHSSCSLWFLIMVIWGEHWEPQCEVSYFDKLSLCKYSGFAMCDFPKRPN